MAVSGKNRFGYTDEAPDPPVDPTTESDLFPLDVGGSVRWRYTDENGDVRALSTGSEIDDAVQVETDRAEAAEAAIASDLVDEAALARNADNLTSGTVADARVASTIARDSEVTAAVAAEALLARDGDNITSGTVADARVASTIARDSEVTAAVAALSTVYQPLDTDLTAIAALVSAADKLGYATGAGTWSLTDFTAAGRALIDDANASAQRTTLGLGTAAVVDTGTSGANVPTVTQADARYQALDATLTAIAAIVTAADALMYATGVDTFATTTLTSFMRTVLDDVDAATARTTLGVTIGTNVQAWDADLDAIAALTSAADKLPYATGAQAWALTTLSSFIRTLLDDADATTARATLGLVIGTNVQAFDAELSAIAGLTSAADKLPYFTGSGTAATADFTSTARLLLDDSSTSAMRTTLGLGASATRALGNSVVDPGTTALEIAFPAQAQVTGNSKVWATTDMDKYQSRSNSGTNMTDTMPTGASAVDGMHIIVANEDTTATITFTAAAAQTFVSATGAAGASTFVLYPGRRTQFVWYQTGGFWRLLQNNNNLSKLKTGVTAVLGNIPKFSTNTNGNEFDDSGFSPASFALATPAMGTGLGTSGTVNLDLAALNGTGQTIALSGNITFTTSNLAANRSVSLFISSAALRTFTFPATWIFVGTAAPASIAAGKAGVLTFTSTTTSDAGVYAAWAVQP